MFALLFFQNVNDTETLLARNENAFSGISTRLVYGDAQRLLLFAKQCDDRRRANGGKNRDPHLPAEMLHRIRQSQETCPSDIANCY